MATFPDYFTIENANTRSSWLEETRAEFGQLQREDSQIRLGEREPRVFITINVLLRSKELNLLHQKLTLNENTPSVMLFEMTKSGKIGAEMKAR